MAVSSRVDLHASGRMAPLFQERHNNCAEVPLIILLVLESLSCGARVRADPSSIIYHFTPTSIGTGSFTAHTFPSEHAVSMAIACHLGADAAKNVPMQAGPPTNPGKHSESPSPPREPPQKNSPRERSRISELSNMKIKSTKPESPCSPPPPSPSPFQHSLERRFHSLEEPHNMNPPAHSCRQPPAAIWDVPAQPAIDLWVVVARYVEYLTWVGVPTYAKSAKSADLFRRTTRSLLT